VYEDIGNIVMETLDSCIVCGYKRMTRVMEAIDNQYGSHGRWTVVKCTACSHMFLNPRPTSQEIVSYYPSGVYYTHKESITSGGFLRNAVMEVHFGLHRKLFWFRRFFLSGLHALFARYVNILPPFSHERSLRLLDVGCGNGYLMAFFARYGYEVWGQEISPEAGLLARSVTPRVHIGPLEEAPFPRESFDVVIMNQVLEHVHRPLSFLQIARSFLRPDGMLIVSVPNNACYDARLFKESWWALQVPTHLSFFTPASLELTLNKAGFVVKQWGFSGAYKGYSKNALQTNFRYLRENSRLLHKWSSLRFIFETIKILSNIVLVKPLLLLGSLGIPRLWSDRMTCYAVLEEH